MTYLSYLNNNTVLLFRFVIYSFKSLVTFFLLSVLTNLVGNLQLSIRSLWIVYFIRLAVVCVIPRNFREL